MKKIPIKKDAVFLVVIILSIVAALLSVVLSQFYDAENIGISNLKAYSYDNRIFLTWSSIGRGHVELKITSSDDNIIETVDLISGESDYSYITGEHGKKYNFSVSLKNADQYIGTSCTQTALFLDYTKIPDLPVVRIETKNEKKPSYTVVDPPEGGMGQSIADNEYVAAKFTVLNDGVQTAFSLTGKIRIRGNTSATMAVKKPFKIVLDHPVDLLGRSDKQYADSEWLLIACDYAFKTVSGMKIAELFGMEWQPQFQPVNVMMNGDWLGCYYLCENITIGPHRMNISKDGFMIEHDAYWWNEEVYFATPNQPSRIAYTFMYPQIRSNTDPVLESVRSYVVAFENSLENGYQAFERYIDVDSFVNWLLIHDVLGTWDAGGSNMFLYKQDAQEGSKLKAGPVWDFGTIFEQQGQWSRIHTSKLMYYDLLLQNTSFLEAYKARWCVLTETVVPDIAAYLYDHVDECGTAMQESWLLDAEKYDIEVPTISEALGNTLQWFQTRKTWLDTNIQQLK